MLAERTMVVAREVLLADAANLSSHFVIAPAQEGDNQVKSARERAEEKRAEKLELIDRQVKEGSLLIRQMTDEERRRYPPSARRSNPGSRALSRRAT